MTNREAIEKFKKIKRGNIFLIHQRIEGKEVIEDYSLCDMAIFALQALDEIYAFIMKSEASETTDGVLEIFDALEAQGLKQELKQEVKNSNGSSLTQKALDTISRTAAIDTEGLDEEIRCEMCRNQMKTYRGCDGNCKYDEKLYEKIMQILNERIKPLPSAQPEWNNHTVACLLAELFDDTCACNYNGIDEWLPSKCELLDSCPNPVGVACWEQYLKHRAERRTSSE